MDQEDVTLVSLLVHVPFIIAWIGLVILDAVAVFTPGMQVDQRSRLLLWSRPFVALAIIVIMVTGIWQTMHNPFFEVSSWSDLQELKKRDYGLLLFWKHVFVIATFGLTVITRFFLARRMNEPVAVNAGGVLAMTYGQSGFNLAKLATLANVSACLLIVLLATGMIYQLH